MDVSNTSQFRDLANSSSRIFGWHQKANPQTQYNQVVISQDQLREIGMLRDKMTPEESEEVSRKLSEMTPEGMEEFGRNARELLARERNMEQPKLPPNAIGPQNLRSDDKGRWRRSEDKAMSGNVTTALQVNATTGNGVTTLVLPEPRLVTLAEG